MAGRLALDFGTSNSVVAVWDERRQEGVPLHIPEYGRFIEQNGEQISVIPSLIHYAAGEGAATANPADEQHWIGNQVLERGLYQASGTFRWMKRYILNRSPLQKLAAGRRISPLEA